MNRTNAGKELGDGVMRPVRRSPTLVGRGSGRPKGFRKESNVPQDIAVQRHRSADLSDEALNIFGQHRGSPRSRSRVCRPPGRLIYPGLIGASPSYQFFALPVYLLRACRG
jgi:hypothetical protein